MSLIQLQEVSFSYEGSAHQVFQNLSLQADTCWRLGVIGRNGCGKTTLLRLLAKELFPDRGSLIIPSDGVMFPFIIPDPTMTAEDLGWMLSEDFRPWQTLREMHLLEVSEDLLYRPLSSMSGGERTKIQLALLFGMQEHLLLIDEPTNHLDALGRSRVGDYLAQKKGFILVSHDRDFLDRSVDHILCLDGKGARLIRGNYSVWQLEEQRRIEAERLQNQQLKVEISRLTEAVRQVSQWAEAIEKSKKGRHAKNASGLRPDRGYLGHQSAKMMSRAKNIQRRRLEAVKEKQSLLKNTPDSPALDLHPLPCPWPRVAELRQISVVRDGHIVLEDLSLTILPGERVALAGPNGCGKTTLLHLLTGQESPSLGSILLPQGLVISTVPQDSSFLSGSLDCFIDERQLDDTLLRTILRKLGFSRTQFEVDLSCWSAGQKKKALLAASLCRPAHLYLWDEPLNYVDLDSRLQLEELLMHRQPTMIFVEHDRVFRQRVATRIFPLHR